MSLTWQDASDRTAGVGAGADVYLHWAACGGIRHLQQWDGQSSCWVTFMVGWKNGERWTQAVNELRAELGADGSVLITTLPAALDKNLDFPFAALSVRLSRQKGEQEQQIVKLATKLLTSQGARRLELSLSMHQSGLDRERLNSAGAPDYSGLEDPKTSRHQADDVPECRDKDGVYRLLAVIDDVIPFGHSGVKPHLHALWLQGDGPQGRTVEITLRAGATAVPSTCELRPDRDGSAPAGDLALPQVRHQLPMGWGTEALHDVAVAMGHRGARRHVSHGAHVISLALAKQGVRDRQPAPDGPLPQVDNDMPPVGLVGVQLPWDAVRDTSGRWLGGHILAGLIYALDCAWFLPGRRPARTQPEHRDDERPRHVVANLSYGYTTGPHDGSSLLEQAMDELCRRFDGAPPNADRRSGPPMRLDICLPAGNSFDARSHARLDIAPKGKGSLTWRVLPDGHRPAFLELWLDDLAQARLTIKAPAGKADAFDLNQGRSSQWQLRNGTASPVAFLRICPVDKRYQVLLALEPTALDEGWTAAPAGDWVVHLDNTGQHELKVQAFVARSTPHMYSRRDGTLSYLVDCAYDPERYMRCREDDPQPGQPLADVRRRGTLNGIATGSRPQVATGMLRRGKEGQAGDVMKVHALYASAGPAGTSMSRNPDVAYITDDSRALPGVLGRGNHGASRVRLVGTSTAAPQLARDLLSGTSSKGSSSPTTGPAIPEELFGRVQR